MCTLCCLTKIDVLMFYCVKILVLDQIALHSIVPYRASLVFYIRSQAITIPGADTYERVSRQYPYD